MAETDSKIKAIFTLINNIFNKISYFGIREDTDEFLKKKIILANRLSVVLSIFFFVIASILGIKFRLVITSIILLILVAILIGVPFLNQIKRSDLARVLLSLVLPVFIYIASIYVKLNYNTGREVVFYFLPRTAMVITVIIPLLVLDFRQKVQYFLVLLFYALCILFYSSIHNYLGIGIEHAILTGSSYLLASVIPVLILMVLIIAFILMQKINYQYEQSLIKKILS